MTKVSLIFVVIAMCLMASSTALPRQYRYYPPSPSRFAGWTVTSQELLALPSQNDPANVVRVAPPEDFLKSHNINRRSSLRNMSPELSPLFRNRQDYYADLPRYNY